MIRELFKKIKLILGNGNVAVGQEREMIDEVQSKSETALNKIGNKGSNKGSSGKSGGRQSFKDTITRSDIDNIVRWYREGYSSVKIAEHYGVGAQTIINLLRAEGVEIRCKGGSRSFQNRGKLELNNKGNDVKCTKSPSGYKLKDYSVNDLKRMYYFLGKYSKVAAVLKVSPETIRQRLKDEIDINNMGILRQQNEKHL